MASGSAESLSLWEIRRRVRRLPRERRKDVVASIREGRAVTDPRDAALAAALAERLSAYARRTPWWLLPLQRPRGWRARLWVAHVALTAVALVFVIAAMWSTLPGLWRWVVVGFLVYSAITTPLTMRKMFRTYWNAPEAARRNREAASHPAGHCIT